VIQGLTWSISQLSRFASKLSATRKALRFDYELFVEAIHIAATRLDVQSSRFLDCSNFNHGRSCKIHGECISRASISNMPLANGIMKKENA
jgi:hypothetical protein